MKHKEYTIQYMGIDVITIYPYCTSGKIQEVMYPECFSQIIFSGVPLLVFKSERVSVEAFLRTLLFSPKLPEPTNTDILIISVAKDDESTWLTQYLINYYKNKYDILVLYEFHKNRAFVVHSNNEFFTPFSYECIIDTKQSTYIDSDMNIYCNPSIDKKLRTDKESEQCVLEQVFGYSMKEKIPEIEMKLAHIRREKELSKISKELQSYIKKKNK